MWVAENHYLVLGTRFCVRSDDSDAAQRLDHLLAPFRSDDSKPVQGRDLFVLASSRPGDDRPHAFRDCRRIARFDSWNEIFDPVLGEINRRAVEEMEYFGVHAGVVASPGIAMALPGESGAGKTTLVASLLQAGFSYVSDEALCIDYLSRAVISYPKPLALSSWSRQALDLPSDGGEEGKTPVSPDAIGKIAVEPPPLGAVIEFHRSPGPASLRTLPASQVVATLLRYSFNHYKSPARAFELAVDLARDSSAWSLTYDHPRNGAELLRSEFA